jgi:hypothetical protein
MRGRESLIAGRAIGVVLAVRCYGGFGGEIREEDDDQEKLNKVPYIVLERGRRRRGRRCD